MEAVSKGQDHSVTVMIHRDGSPIANNLLEVDEDYLYPGNENPIIMINYFEIKLGCKLDLEWYYKRYTSFMTRQFYSF